MFDREAIKLSIVSRIKSRKVQVNWNQNQESCSEGMGCYCVFPAMVANDSSQKGATVRNPERRDPVKEKFWRKNLSEYRRSKLGKEEFCREQGLSIAAMNWWMRELRIRDEEVPGVVGNVKRTAARSGESHWSEVLSDWQEGGLTLEQFARGRKLNLRALNYWKNKLLPSEGLDSGATIKEESVSFIPVHLVDQQPTSLSSESESRVLEIVLKCGRLIRVGPNFQPEFLRAVVLAVESC